MFAAALPLNVAAQPLDRKINELFALTSPGGTPRYMDIGAWGKLIIYDTPEDAIDSLSEEERDQQYVRLVLVAQHRQLIKMLANGKELCRPRAALYMRLDRTCPLYHLTWDESCEESVIEVESSLPQAGTRETMLNAVKGSPEGGKYAIYATVSAKRKGSRGRNAHNGAMYVNPGQHVVGGTEFNRSMSAKRRINEAEEEGSGPDSDGEEGAREDDSCDS